MLKINFKKLKYSWPVIIILVLIIANLFFLYLNTGRNLERTITLLSKIQSINIKEYVAGFGIIAPIVLMLLIILQMIIAPIPGQITTITAGALYGPIFGTSLVIVSNVIGASICFKIAEHFGRPLVERIVNKKELDIVEQFINTKKGVVALVLLRLMPLISFDVVSYVLGLTGLDFKKYLLITIIGMVPGTVIYSLIGHNLIEGNLLLLFILPLILIFILVVTPVLVEKLKK